MIADLWRYRAFILTMVKREFAARYLRSALGSAWAVVGPLSIVLLYTVVFGKLMHARLPGLDDSMAYGVFACTGVLTFGAFSEVITRSLAVFVEHANLLKKINFPRATLPAIVLLSAALNFVIVFGLFLAVLAITGRFPGWAVLAVVPLFALQQALALGLGVALGVINVFLRDVGHVVGLALQLWFWFTPIVYPQSVLGDSVRWLLDLNPLTHIVVGYQQIILNGTWPEWASLILPALVAAAMLGLGLTTFRRLSAEMPDYL